jgi:hypothetical protein
MGSRQITHSSSSSSSFGFSGFFSARTLGCTGAFDVELTEGVAVAAFFLAWTLGSAELVDVEAEVVASLVFFSVRGLGFAELFAAEAAAFSAFFSS